MRTTRTDIENARKEIGEATKEIERQKKDLSDVQYLVRNLFNKTETEKFEGAEQGRLFIAEVPKAAHGTKTLIVFVLKKVPIKSSVRLQFHIYSQPPGSYIIANNVVILGWGDSVDTATSKPFYIEYVADPSRESDGVQVSSFDGGILKFNGAPMTDSFEPPRGVEIPGLELKKAGP